MGKYYNHIMEHINHRYAVFHSDRIFINFYLQTYKTTDRATEVSMIKYRERIIILIQLFAIVFLDRTLLF